MSVIHHDFGGGKRRASQRLRKLLTLDALHEQNVQSNPLPYLERASERIFQLEKTVFEAVIAARPEPGVATDGAMVSVNAAEYRRLQAALAILEAAFDRLEVTGADSGGCDI